LVKSREADLAGLLQAALEKTEVGKALEGLLPEYPEYRSLRKALHAYRGIAERGGWPPVPEVRDDQAERAVRRFQGRHGLTVDGVVCPSTLAALNAPVEDRVRQIEINREGPLRYQ
jgi:murein L,D-transpeptidase YcbB/YkuD